MLALWNKQNFRNSRQSPELTSSRTPLIAPISFQDSSQLACTLLNSSSLPIVETDIHILLPLTPRSCDHESRLQCTTSDWAFLDKAQLASILYSMLDVSSINTPASEVMEILLGHTVVRL